MTKKTTLQYDLTRGWQFRRAGERQWYPAAVPGCIHLDLLNSKLIEDPFYRDNESKVQWIENSDWEYQLFFDVPSEIFSSPHIEIVFDGLDTYAMVVLNDHKIIDANNMFRPWASDVKWLLKAKQNKLIVNFRSPVQEVAAKIERVEQRLPAMNELQLATCPYTRKAPYHYGWDWGPRLVTSGIWQPVRLLAWQDIHIVDQQILITKLNDRKAWLRIVVEVLADADLKATLRISHDRGTESLEKTVKLRPGENRIAVDFEIKNPELWFPNGYGEQPLYTFSTEISTEQAMSPIQKRMGLRTVAVEQKPDQWGESFTVVVNGQPIFMKGANWIPADSFPPRVSEATYRHLLRSATAANMNMLRVWGGGIYEADLFYDLCDELGILVWQDFMFSCALYPADEKFLDSVREEARYQVRRLRHHPCLALWCGNNEIEMGWQDWGWQQQLSAERWEDYLMLFHSVLPEICRHEDPEHFYWASSPASDSQAIIDPNNDSRGDTHYWGVWHGQEPFENYQQHFPRFISEFGFQSFPAPESVASFTTPEDRDIFSPVMRIHQKNSNGNTIIRNYLEEYYTLPGQFDHFLLLSQVLQAEGIKIGAEHFRRIRPRCMGSLYWQLNDCWPVASWSSIDYFGRWKALHYYARRFYAPILISPHLENNACRFAIISDRTEPTPANLHITIQDFAGKLRLKYDQEILIAPNQAAIYHTLPDSELNDIDPANSFVYCFLENGGAIISENFLYFNKPRDLKLLPPEISTAVKKQKSGYLITVSAKNLARAVVLRTTNIEGYFEDNFFDILPGGQRQVRFVTRAKLTAPQLQQALSVESLYELMELH